MPGFSLHQEFELLAEARLSPHAILRITTCDAATFLGLEARLGTVGEGKVANLVLLDAMPLADVRNLSAISGMVRAGDYLDADALSALIGPVVS